MDWTTGPAAHEGSDRIMAASTSQSGDSKSSVDTDGPTQITPNVVGVRTDKQLREFLAGSRGSMAVVNFGSSWCAHCHAMLPTFLSLAKQHDSAQFAVAQVDYLHDLLGVTHTPTFAIYKKGTKVDQFFGADDQRLKDHIWLQAD